KKFQNYNIYVGNLFADLNKFKNEAYLHSRRYDIGFVGRLHREKRLLNFLKALELLDEELSIVIIGDSEEKDNVLNGIRLLNSMGKLDITYIDWVDNAKLSSYLNKIKLLVIPSYKEGLPNIVLESMSCGCVVLATPVGGIPEVIKNGATGFIMEDNSPACIAENVERVLNYPDLEGIVKNASKQMEEEYTYEAAVKRYRKILKELPWP
ncbi:MAG TPA: hypothetical protein C5S37_08495, partial [Methanophagales archaeon]|nr:hypothetical protein [Methanophagales archaeon]